MPGSTVRHFDRRECEDGCHRLQLRCVEFDCGYESGPGRNRRVNGDVDRPEPILDGADERGNAAEVGEIGWERYRLDAGASEFGDPFFERRGAARDERDPIAFAPELRGE
jgi:hypothetical protein